MQSKRSLYPRWSLAILLSAVLGVLGTNLPANAACTNPTPLPPGYASPCPVWSVSPASISQSGTETLTATPQPGTDYIYTTAYISQGTTWNPYILAGNNAAPNYSSALASLTLSSAQLSALSIGTHYTVVWDWLWDATAQCYKGPGLNQCNTGQWRVQSFTITSTYVYSQSAYYTYSQSSYYAYSQAAYASAPVASLSPTSLTFPSQTVGITSPTQYVTLTGTGVSTYAYSQSAYYAYSQSAYYTYFQSAYSSGANNYYVSTTGSDS